MYGEWDSHLEFKHNVALRELVMFVFEVESYIAMFRAHFHRKQYVSEQSLNVYPCCHRNRNILRYMHTKWNMH